MQYTSSVEVIRGEVGHSQPIVGTRPPFKIPLFLWLVILTFVCCFMASIMPLSKPAVSLPDIFADYVDFFPGGYWSTALERAFRCNVDVATGAKYCFLRPQDGLFSDIGVTIINDQISQIVFALHQSALKAGDLAALWGRPEIQISGYIAYLGWQNQKVKAIARTDDGRFDYFLHLSSLAFN